MSGINRCYKERGLTFPRQESKWTKRTGWEGLEGWPTVINHASFFFLTRLATIIYNIGLRYQSESHAEPPVSTRVGLCTFVRTEMWPLWHLCTQVTLPCWTSFIHRSTSFLNQNLNFLVVDGLVRWCCSLRLSFDYERAPQYDSGSSSVLGGFSYLLLGNCACWRYVRQFAANRQHTPSPDYCTSNCSFRTRAIDRLSI